MNPFIHRRHSQVLASRLEGMLTTEHGWVRAYGKSRLIKSFMARASISLSFSVSPPPPNRANNQMSCLRSIDGQHLYTTHHNQTGACH